VCLCSVLFSSILSSECFGLFHTETFKEHLWMISANFQSLAPCTLGVNLALYSALINTVWRSSSISRCWINTLAEYLSELHILHTDLQTLQSRTWSFGEERELTEQLRFLQIPTTPKHIRCHLRAAMISAATKMPNDNRMNQPYGAEDRMLPAAIRRQNWRLNHVLRPITNHLPLHCFQHICFSLSNN